MDKTGDQKKDVTNGDKAPSSSSHSSVKPIKQEELETKKKIMQLQHEMEESCEVIDDKISDLEAELKKILDIKKTMSDAEFQEKQVSLKKRMEEIEKEMSNLSRQRERIVKQFDRKKRHLLELSQINKEIIEVDNMDDNSQYLGSDDEGPDVQGRQYSNGALPKKDDIPLAYDIFKMPPDPPFDLRRPVPVKQAMDHGITPPKAEEAPAGTDMSAKVIQLLDTQLKLMEQAPGGSYHADKRLPTFDGNPGDWLNFVSAYNRSTAKYKFDEAVNMMRLQEALKGKAKEAVEHLMANPYNVDYILNVLFRRFGRPEYVLDYLVEKAKAAKPPDLNKPETIVDFGTAVQSLITNVCSYNEQEYLHNKQLVKELVDKLPRPLRTQWYEWLEEDDYRRTNLENFSFWLNKKMKIAEREVKPSFTETVKSERGRRGPGLHAAAPGSQSDKCECCNKENHTIDKCFAFKKKSVDDRWEIVKDKKLCFICLGLRHRKRQCKNAEPCGVDECKKQHHPLLHHKANSSGKKSSKGNKKSAKKVVVTVKQQQSESDSESERESEDDDKAPSSQPAKDGVMGTVASADILPIIPVYLKGPNGKKKVYALLDTGASFSMLEAGAARKLGIRGKTEKLDFTVFGAKRQEMDSECVSVKVQGAFKNAPTFTIKSVHTVDRLGLPSRSFEADVWKRKYPHLRKMMAKSMRDARPEMVIGMNAGGLFAAREILELSPGSSPAGVKSLLGWYLIQDQEIAENHFQFACRCQEDNEELHSLFKTFYSTEGFGVAVTKESGRSVEDRRALQILERETEKIGKRWRTSLLWKGDNVCLPESRQMAFKRLQNMERKMDKNPEFGKLCTEKFNEYISKGYLVPVDSLGDACGVGPSTDEGCGLRAGGEECTVSNKNRKWYLPWFFAYHTTKKPRLVFDAAATSNGKSLNDFLLKGPDLIRPLPEVLMRFRQHVIGITGDIKEMFHQVELKVEDRSSQTVLYREMNRDRTPTEYQMSVLFFGSAASPCSAIFTKNKNAEMFQKQYPTAAEAIVRDFYVDDYLGGADTEEDAIKLRNEVSKINLEGGFLVTKWSSNSGEVLSSIPEELRAEGQRIVSEKDEFKAEKTLGLYWDSSEDTFRFKLNFNRVPEEVLQGRRLPTKREMASIIMSLFDPLGFLSPFKVRALIMLQQVWRTGVNWDDEMPQSLENRWKEWLEDLPKIAELYIQRRYALTSLKTAARTELHVFCDASEEAFSAVAYLRTDTGGSTHVAFVLGKARVAPLKGLTIPRMELQAAVMGIRLAKAVKEAFAPNLKIDDVIYWTDSRTVLCWIRSTSGRFNQFVSNRIGEILESSDVAEWRWVPTTHNAADDATRSKKGTDLSPESRWLHGPSFLKLEPREWPQEKKDETQARDEDMEYRGVMSSAAKASEASALPDISRFSNWNRLIRATAMVFFALRKMRKQGPPHLTMAEIDKATQMWMAKSQEESFPNEVKALKERKEFPKTSRIYKLSPTLDVNNVIVLRGRIEKAQLGPSVKQPPILDKNHRYTQLLVESYHRSGGHFGQERLVNELRKKAWIVDSRAAVKRCVAKCLVCRQRRASPEPPMMGQLPESRLEAGRPAFYHTGVDYFGPYLVKERRSHVKRWGVLFTCLTTRAVHLELAVSLDTSDFLNVLTRFINLRGKPSHLWSDNATNFVGAQRELKEALESWKEEEIRAEMQIRGMEFHKIPQASPHMGGSWERMIGSVKRILAVIMKEKFPTEDILRTLFAEVTGILNSRPLTHASPDPDDLECLTPNHLLNVPCVIGPSLPGMSDGRRFQKSWRLAQDLSDAFWRRWSQEYLPWLANRQKWHKEQTPLKVGEVVVVVEDNAPRNCWKKGIIEEVRQGRDGQVRSAVVKVTSVDSTDPKKVVKVSHLTRPAVKLCRLSLTKECATEYAERENVRPRIV